MRGVGWERFAPGAGRRRPRHEPRALNCEKCGAGFQIKDERAEFLVCTYCGSRYQVLREGLSRLEEERRRRSWFFHCHLGDSFQLGAIRYEVIARLVFIEDEDPEDRTYQYLLYNPRRGSFWIDVYQEKVAISWTTHVMPACDDPFAQEKDWPVKTHDGRCWRVAESGEYELVYVDGTLPWVARLGDRVSYVEFAALDGTKDTYEVQEVDGEREFAMGRSLSREEVAWATGGKWRAYRAFVPSDTLGWFLEGVRPGAYRDLALWAIGCVLVCLAVFAASRMMGTQVFDQTVHFQELTGETNTDDFRTMRDGSVLEVDLSSMALREAWLELDAALVNGEGMTRHVFGADLWHEGGTPEETGGEVLEQRVYLEVPRAGQYRFLVHWNAASHLYEGGRSFRIVAREGRRSPIASEVAGALAFLTAVAGCCFHVLQRAFLRKESG